MVMVNQRSIFLVRIITQLGGTLLVHADFDLNSSYIGCYVNISSTKTDQVTSVEECKTLCKDENNVMVGLRDGKECNCIERLNSAVSSDRCNTPCPNSNACGGKDLYSIYRSKHRNIHRLKYAYPRIFEATGFHFIVRHMTVEECIHYCVEMNASHAMLETGIAECLCVLGLGYNTPVMGTVICDACKHDIKEMCWCHFKDIRAYAYIYGDFYNYDFQRGLSIYSHCYGASLYSGRFDKCFNPCYEGWKGVSCRERDCSVKNGDCERGTKCIESTVNGNKYPECVCPYGTVKNKITQVCAVFRHNLALFKPSYSSSVYSDERGAWLASYLTDSLTDGYYAARIMDSQSAWLAVDLIKSYCVGYVIAFHCHFNVITVKESINNFVIRLNETFDTNAKYDIRNKLHKCGFYPNEGAHPSTAMRVNCENYTLVSRFVIVQPSDAKMVEGVFALGELEVYEVGCDIFNGRCGDLKCKEVLNNDSVKIIECITINASLVIDKPLICKCFRRVEYEFEHDLAGQSNEECLANCQNRSYTFTVLKEGWLCACGNKLIVNEEAPVAKCLRRQYETYLVYDKWFEDANSCEDNPGIGVGNLIYIIVGAVCGFLLFMTIVVCLIRRRKPKIKVNQPTELSSQS